MILDRIELFVRVLFVYCVGDRYLNVQGCRNGTDRRKPCPGREDLPQGRFPTKNSTWTGLGSHTGISGDRPKTNCLRCKNIEANEERGRGVTREYI